MSALRPCHGFALALLLASSSLQTTVAQDSAWPTFRGTGRTATSGDTGLMTTWPAEGPKLVWEAKGAGRGYASLAVAGGRIYTLGDGLSTASDGQEYLTCFDLKTGEQLWRTSTGEPWNSGNPQWQSSRSTPTVDEDRVYVLTPFGVLVCCESANGKLLWSKNLKEEFGGKKGDGWGYSESVLIDGERLICTPGGEQTTMAALDKRTGDVVWKTVREGDRGAGHASIAISQIGGTRVLVQTTASGALGVRADDGKVLWSYPIDKTTAVIPTPIVRDDLVFFAAGYGRGGALLRQKPAGDGEVMVEEIYPVQTDLANKHGGVVLVGDHVFGDSDDRGMPFCAELMTGKILWKQRGSGRGSASIAAADGHLYIRYSDGTVVLVKANGDAYEEVGKFKVPGSGERPSWSHPVIVGGQLLLREGDSILCYDLRG